MLRAQERCLHQFRMEKAMSYCEKVKGPHFETFVTLINQDGKVDHVRQVVPDYIPADKPLGEILSHLTYYHDFMPTVKKVEQLGNREVTREVRQDGIVKK